MMDKLAVFRQRVRIGMKKQALHFRQYGSRKQAIPDGFWENISRQISELRSAKSADDVIRILGPGEPGLGSGDAFFEGSGGDEQVLPALMDAGWKIVWADADYYFAAQAPDGSGITYVEGDIYKGIQQPHVGSRIRAELLVEQPGAPDSFWWRANDLGLYDGMPRSFVNATNSLALANTWEDPRFDVEVLLGVLAGQLLQAEEQRGLVGGKALSAEIWAALKQRRIGSYADFQKSSQSRVAYDPGNAGTNEPPGRYSPVPGEPFRWLEDPVYSPEHLKFREMFPNGVPMRDEDMTPEQLAYWKSNPKISERKHGLSGMWRWEDDINLGHLSNDTASATAYEKGTGREVAYVTEKQDGTWEWGVFGPPDSQGHQYVSQEKNGEASTMDEAMKAAEFAGISFPGQEKLPFAARRKIAEAEFQNLKDYIGRGLVGHPGSEILSINWLANDLQDWQAGSPVYQVEVRLGDGRVVNMPLAIGGIRTFERKGSRRQGSPIGDWKFDEHVEIIDATPRSKVDEIWAKMNESEKFGVPMGLFPAWVGELTHEEVVELMGKTGSRKTARAIYEIAEDIAREWGADKINYAAKPYLEAMFSLDSITDNYGYDSAKSVVAYFLSNASSFRGEQAKALKAELKDLLAGKTSSRKQAGVSLTNIRIVDREGRIFAGKDSSGNEVQFRASEEDAQSLFSVMFGDLAQNFSGVTVDEADIVSTGSRKQAVLSTQDIYERLDDTHCEFCEGMATGLQAWWSDPDSVQGVEQREAITEHLLKSRRDEWTSEVPGPHPLYEGRKKIALDPQSGYGDSGLETVEEDPDELPMWPWEIGLVGDEEVSHVGLSLWAQNGIEILAADEYVKREKEKPDADTVQVSDDDEPMWPWEIEELKHEGVTLDPDRDPEQIEVSDAPDSLDDYDELPGDSEDPTVGQGAADVADVPTPGDALADQGYYPQPEIIDDIAASYASRRRQAWTEDGSDITEGAATLMDLQTQAFDALGIQGYRGTEDQKDADKARVVQWIVDRLGDASGISEADMLIAEDYNAHSAVEAWHIVKGASRKTAYKGIAIYPDKRVEEVEINDYKDLQAIVGGLIEPISLNEGSEMYVNEEYLYSFGPDDFNSIASDVAGLGGRPEFMLRQPILGPAVVVGGLDEEGYNTDISESGRRLVQRVSREATTKTGEQLTWRDIEYQEEHGVLPTDNSMTADEFHEYYGDDPEAVQDYLDTVDIMNDEDLDRYSNLHRVGEWYDELGDDEKEEDDEGEGNGEAADSSDSDAGASEDAEAETEDSEEEPVESGETAPQGVNEKKEARFRQKVLASLKERS